MEWRLKNNFKENFKQDLKGNYKKTLFIVIPIFVVMLVLDLLTKYFVNKYIPLHESRDFLPHFINLINTHNEGAGFSLLNGKTIFLIIFTSLFLCLFVFYYLTQVKNNALFHVSAGFIMVGCLGNLIDRIAFGYVRDMLHFEFWPSFPVFNVADMCVCIGIFLFILFYLIGVIKGFKKGKNE